ncbi:hypothetical protein K1T71_005101 [Dendrolimus kikuchii]|uniref:Uncharacterized protein n=1 Tax=Dendrolimus kikuchii TaxID=765133 RepID=A0ACC1D615_9NEOP|nr:hypothetical protein K1T71_005101 [Dendrolimus kikuchii]
MTSKMNINEVNSLNDDQFEWVFINVIELCTDAAVKVKKLRPFKGLADLCNAFHKYLDDLSLEEKLVILKLHPDLAGRLADRGQLTRESTSEQRSAGLHELTPEQKGIINERNERYKIKFDFPFVICARENKVQSIMDGLQARYNNTKEQEIFIGIDEVKKICTFRIYDIVKEDY